MPDQRCLCLAPTMVETVRDDAVARACRTLDGEPGAAERAAASSLANRLAARLLVLSVASCPNHGLPVTGDTGEATGNAARLGRVAGTADR